MNESQRRARRAEQARRIRRRRRAALAVVVLVAAAVAAVLALDRGGDSGQRASARGSDHGQRDASSRKRKSKSKSSAPALPTTVPASAPGAHRAPGEPVPILMYHVIGTPKPDTPNQELWVPDADFRAEMRALADRGYHGVTLQQVYDAWHHGGLLPSKPIVISFDDGYTGQYTVGVPTLRALGWPGVLNFKLGNLRDLHNDRIRGFVAAGWEVDSHTINHPDLTTLDAAGLRHELVDSRARLRREFGAAANFFCYPAGRFDSRVVEAVRAAGYLGATTTQAGFARPQDKFTLARVRVNGSDGVTGLVDKLSALGATPNAPPSGPQGSGA